MPQELQSTLPFWKWPEMPQNYAMERAAGKIESLYPTTNSQSTNFEFSLLIRTSFTNSSDSFTNLEFRIYWFFLQILKYYDLFFNWKTEKKNCFGPIRSLFSFSTAQSDKKKWRKSLNKLVKTSDEFIITCLVSLVCLFVYLSLFFHRKNWIS